VTWGDYQTEPPALFRLIHAGHPSHIIQARGAHAWLVLAEMIEQAEAIEALEAKGK
jgi:hypothetical protein